jgi:hypothetical protein
MKHILLLLVLLLVLPVAVYPQIFVGPGDTLKFPIILLDSVGNPVAAVDSAADSVLVRVIKMTAANGATGKDTCYFHRGLLDASTNSLVRTAATASNAVYGARAFHSFDFVAVYIH